jgi:hypothetical protein
MSVCSVPESSEQQRCEYCGDAIPPGGRRPREYCSDAHRQAAFRKRRTPSWLLPQRPPSENSPATESAKNGAENPNEINGRNFVTNGSSVPLDLFGRRHRWAGIMANGNAVKVSAAVDAELGVGAEWLTSPGGALYQVIPSRRAR